MFQTTCSSLPYPLIKPDGIYNAKCWPCATLICTKKGGAILRCMENLNFNLQNGKRRKGGKRRVWHLPSGNKGTLCFPLIFSEGGGGRKRLHLHSAKKTHFHFESSPPFFSPHEKVKKGEEKGTKIRNKKEADSGYVSLLCSIKFRPSIGGKSFFFAKIRPMQSSHRMQRLVILFFSFSISHTCPGGKGEGEISATFPFPQTRTKKGNNKERKENRKVSLGNPGASDSFFLWHRPQQGQKTQISFFKEIAGVKQTAFERFVWNLPYGREANLKSSSSRARRKKSAYVREFAAIRIVLHIFIFRHLGGTVLLRKRRRVPPPKNRRWHARSHKKNLLLLPTMTFHDAVISRKNTSPDKKTFFSHIMQKKEVVLLFLKKKLFASLFRAHCLFFRKWRREKNLFFMGRGRNYLFNNPFFMWGTWKGLDIPSPFLLFQSCARDRPSILFFYCHNIRESAD